MPNSFENLDMQLSSIRRAYEQCVMYDNWVKAAHFVEIMNNSIPPEARITDLPRSDLPDLSATTVTNANHWYQVYCFRFMPLIEKSISENRHKIIKYYQT